VKPKETSIARLRVSEHIPTAKNTTIEELLETVFSVGSAPRLYNEDHWPAELVIEERWQRGSLQLQQRIGLGVPEFTVVSWD
jgi:hypothetical protein